MEESSDKKQSAIRTVKFCLGTMDKPYDDFDVDNIDEIVLSEQRKLEFEALEKKIEEEHGKLQKPSKYRVFNDSIHMTIELNPLECAILQTPEFFRLKNIKQLGGVCHVYPGAVHTRFEHSIGVCHLAGEFLNILEKKYQRTSDRDKISITSQDKLCVRLAGLCHDLGHGPFSHLFEGIKKRILDKSKPQTEEVTPPDDPQQKSKKMYLEHEQLSVLIFKRILIKHMNVLITFVKEGLNETHVDMIANMIDPQKTYKKPQGKEFLFEIVANKESGLDVDKWDYFTRDCHHLGLTNEFDYGRTMELSSIVSVGKEYHVGFKEKEIHNIYRMFRTRSVLHQKAYAHPVAKGIEMMIEDTLFEICEEKIFADGQKNLLSILEESVKTEAKDRNLDHYIYLTDGILDIIQNNTKNETAKALLKKMMERDIYWCCYEKCIPCYEKSFEKDKEDADHKKTEYETKLKRKYGNDCHTAKVKISYASERHWNPVKKVYFYSEDGKKTLPEGKPITEPEQIVQAVNVPKTYMEFRLRVYYKGSDDREKVKRDVKMAIEPEE